MVDEQDYSFDQMSAGMDKVIERLKQAEKLFDKMLKTAQKLNKTKMSGVGTGGGGNGNKSGAGSSSWDNYEKQTREAIKQMQEMSSIRADLIMLDYDELEARQKVTAENVKANILLRRGNNMMVEEQKTNRAKLSLLKKMIGQTGGAGGLLSMSGVMSMGAGGIGMAGDAVGGGVGKRFGDNAQERIMKYQENISGNKAPVGGSKGSKIFESLTKKFPKLASGIFGGAEEGGKLKGGLLGKAGGMAGKGGALGGMAGGAGGGILGAMIMKGLESSPMFQAVSKIMNQAFGLYLRPIGDFVGSFFMPIARIIMMEGAINAKQSKKFMSMGEQLGKITIALFKNPAAVFMSAFADIGRQLADIIKKSGIPYFSDLGKVLEEKLSTVAPLFSGFKKIEQNGKEISEWVKGIGDIEYENALADVRERLSGIKGSIDSVDNGLVVYGKSEELKSGIKTGFDSTNKILEEIRDNTNPKKITESLTEDKKVKAEEAMKKFAVEMQKYKFGAKEMAAIIKYGQDHPDYAKGKLGQSTGLFNKDGTAISRKDQLEKMKEDDKNSIGKFGEIWITLSDKAKKILEKVIEQEKLSTKLSAASQAHIDLMTAMHNMIQTEERGKLGDTKKSTIISKFNEGARNSLEKIQLEHQRAAQLIMSDNNKTVIEKQEELTRLQGTTHAKIMSLYSEMIATAAKVTTQYNAYVASMATYSAEEDPLVRPRAAPMVPEPISIGNKVGLSSATVAAQQKLSDTYGVTTYDTKGNISTVPSAASKAAASKAASNVASAYSAAKAAAGGNRPQSTPASTKTTSTAKTNSSSKSKGKASGGMINETIFGIGTSGSTYLFGEAGAEMIIPLNRNPSTNNKNLGAGGTNVVININIEKMSNDMDLNKIKPIVERAILETHARRGII